VTITYGQIQIVDTVPSINQVGIAGNYTQKFDSLFGTGAGRPWTDNSTLRGWYATETSYALGFGLSTGIYSLGYAGGQGDRALGALGGSSSGSSAINTLVAVSFKNLTSSPLTSVAVTYDGEQWNRTAATNQRPSSLLFAYQVFNAGTGAIYFDVTPVGPSSLR
jgi:hypothetical protein